MSFLDADNMQSFWTGAGALWLFSAAVSAMSAPKTDGGFYGWLYRFTHLLAANLDRVLGSAPLAVKTTEATETGASEKEMR